MKNESVWFLEIVCVVAVIAMAIYTIRNTWVTTTVAEAGVKKIARECIDTVFRSMDRFRDKMIWVEDELNKSSSGQNARLIEFLNRDMKELSQKVGLLEEKQKNAWNRAVANKDACFLDIKTPDPHYPNFRIDQLAAAEAISAILSELGLTLKVREGCFVTAVKAEEDKKK